MNLDRTIKLFNDKFGKPKQVHESIEVVYEVDPTIDEEHERLYYTDAAMRALENILEEHPTFIFLAYQIEEIKENTIEIRFLCHNSEKERQ